MACVHKELGDIEACIDALEQCAASGQDMEGPRDDAFFGDLWSHPRFAALFAGLDPRKFTTLEVEDPLVVRNLDLNVGAEVPPELERFENLEVLDLSGEFRALPAWLATLSKLRKLKFYSWGETVIADEILCMPSLELIESYTELSKGYEVVAINQLLKSFHKREVRADARPVHLALLVGRSVEDVSDEAMVEALASTATKVHRAALKELERRWKTRRIELETGAELVVLGRLAADRDVLSERLDRLGVESKKKVGKKTAAIVIGPCHGGKALAHLGGTLLVVLETHLHAALDRQDVRHLQQEGGEETVQQLSELLASVDPGNVAIALEMIKRGGLPGGLLEELFLVAQNNKFDRKLRDAAKTLFERYAKPETVDAVRSELKRTSVFSSGETKLAKRLDALERKSDGELDGRKIALAMFAQGAGALKYLFKKAKKGAPTLDLLERVRKGSSLHLTGLELTRIPDEVCELHGLRLLHARSNRINKLTSGLFALAELEELDLSYNSLREVPDDIAKMTGLRVLVLSSNHFSELPEALTRLHGLEELVFASEQYSEKMKLRSLPESMGGLTHLRKLVVSCHRFEALPDSIRTLKHLEKLDLSHGQVTALPSWLVDLPALQALDVRGTTLSTESVALVDALSSKGVQVTR